MRIQKATIELERANEFDYVLVNNELDLAVNEIKEVVLKFLFAE